MISSNLFQVPSLSLLDDDVPEDIIERIWAYHIIQSLENEQALAEETPDYSMIGDSEIKDKSVQYRCTFSFQSFIRSKTCYVFVYLTRVQLLILGLYQVKEYYVNIISGADRLIYQMITLACFTL